MMYKKAMMHKKVITKRIVSANGQVIAEATSVVVTSANAANSTEQTVVVETSLEGNYSSSYSSSTADSSTL